MLGHCRRLDVTLSASGQASGNFPTESRNRLVSSAMLETDILMVDALLL